MVWYTTVCPTPFVVVPPSTNRVHLLDLLGVPDQTVWNYGQELRRMAKVQGLAHIEFSRLKDLLHIEVAGELNELAYVASASTFRMALLNRYGDHDWDTGASLSKDDDMRTTYCGYIKFLETDLANQYPIGPDRTKSQFKKGSERIANAMLVRGAVSYLPVPYAAMASH